MYGRMGTILRIDLSEEEIVKEPFRVLLDELVVDANDVRTSGKRRFGADFGDQNFLTCVTKCLVYWRRGSESNRRTRLCRPLHDHSATPPRGLARAVPAAPGEPLHDPGSLKNQKGKTAAARFPFVNLERERRLELPTSTLARLRSTN